MINAQDHEDNAIPEFQTRRVIERTWDDSYEAPYSYEPDEAMLEFMEAKFNFDRRIERNDISTDR